MKNTIMTQPWIETRSGIPIPPFIYGTAWKKENTAALVAEALDNGFRGIDTACQPRHYNEFLVGEGVKTFCAKGSARSEIYLQTKFTPVDGQDPNNIPYDPQAPIEEQVAQSFAVSLRNLKTDYLDALILHSPLYPYEKTIKAWHAMEHMVEQNKVRLLGISNCYDLRLLQQLVQDVTISPSIVQNRFYQQTGYDTALREYCRGEGFIYQSFWSLTANPHLLQS